MLMTVIFVGYCYFSEEFICYLLSVICYVLSVICYVLCPIYLLFDNAVIKMVARSTGRKQSLSIYHGKVLVDMADCKHL